MEFDTRLRNKLLSTLRTELPKIELTASGYLDVVSVFDADKVFADVLMNAAKVRAQIEDYVGERPFVSLMYGVVNEELSAVSSVDRAGKNRLCELPPYSDVEALAIRLIALLEALPNHYVAVIELPSCISVEMHKSQEPPILGQNIAVIGLWHGKQEGYPYSPSEVPVKPPQNQLAGLLSSMSAVNTQPIAPLSHLYVRFEGLFKAGYSEHPLARFTTILKAFYGLAIGIELLESGWMRAGAYTYTKVNVYQKALGGFHEVENTSIEGNISALINAISIREGVCARFMQDLSTVARVLDGNSFPQLVLAGRWLFDSYANRDFVMGFMQLAICAEVLLGTEDGSDGVTTMLATRCAYLIATNAKERDALMKEFKSIYQVRSKIVHRGLGTLKTSEHNQFKRLQTIVNRVLHKEIQLALMNDQAH